MPGFGFNKSKNKSTSQTDVSDQSGATGGSEFDQGYTSAGGSTGTTDYDSGSRFAQDVWGPQGGALGDFYNQMSNMWGNFAGPGGGMSNINRSAGGASDYMGGIAGDARGGFQRLMGGGAQGEAGAGMSPDLMASLRSSLSGPSETGKMYENILGGPGNTYADPLIERMRADTTERQGLSDMQGKLEAGGMGQQGSSRQGVADFLRSKDMNKNLGDREAELRSGTYDKDLNWKMKIAELADAGRGSAQDRAIGLMEGGDVNTATGAGMSEMMQNMGMGMMAPWMQSAMMPFQMGGAYGNMLGGPTVIGSGDEWSRGGGTTGTDYTDTGFGRGGSDYDSWQDYLASQSQKSKGSSIGGSFGM